MRMLIVPPELVEKFDVKLSPILRVGPVPITGGRYRGSRAINAEIIESCKEWRTLKPEVAKRAGRKPVPDAERLPGPLEDLTLEWGALEIAEIELTDLGGAEFRAAAVAAGGKR